MQPIELPAVAQLRRELGNVRFEIAQIECGAIVPTRPKDKDEALADLRRREKEALAILSSWT
jgi:hypothetical protein